MTKQQFIQEMAKCVQKYASKYEIAVCSPIIAQACLESAYGTSELATKAHNYFGIKYTAGRCPTVSGYYIKMGSEQNADGSYVSSSMKWCKFDSMEDCVIGYFDFINNSRYSNLKGVTDPKKYLELIKSDGYATSINYVNNVYKVITTYNLTQYDNIPDESTGTVNVTKKYYRVQTGAYSVEKNAKVLQNKLKSDGFNSIIKMVDGLYKVQVGAYSNKANAEVMKEKIKQKGYDAFVSYY